MLRRPFLINRLFCRQNYDDCPEKVFTKAALFWNISQSYLQVYAARIFYLPSYKKREEDLNGLINKVKTLIFVL